MDAYLLLVLMMIACTLAEQSVFLDEIMQPQIPPGSDQLLVTFEPPLVTKLKMKSEARVDLWTKQNLHNLDVLVMSSDPDIARVPVMPLYFDQYNTTHSRASFNITGEFLGYSYIFLQAFNKTSNEASMSPVDYNATEIPGVYEKHVLKQSSNIRVSVIRIPRIIDQIFVTSVALLVSLIYINFGCALNWDVVKATLKRPIGPAIGFICQFGFMPVISFFVGRLLFPGQIGLQLGMFFTGCSPGGGASNIWTVALGGNLDLSITMTTISTFASFAMVPLWVLTLGRVIFEEGRLGVPYSKITTTAAGLLIPLIIGTLIQRFLPKVAKCMVRLMKPFAVFLIIFIVIFGTLTNLYLFRLITWKTVIGGLGIPWLGYLFGALFACIMRQSGRDILAISVETGVQNTGISIFLLRFALDQPEADLAQVCPVAVSLMTPWPLAILSLILRLRRCKKEKHKEGVERLPSTELTTPSLEQASIAPTDKY